jgi:hypothetical protein
MRPRIRDQVGPRSSMPRPGPGCLSKYGEWLVEHGFAQDPTKPGAPWITKDDWVPLAVRWTHPRFFLQHVAFFPS